MEFQTITREMVVTIQGLIILFSGALAYMFNPALQKIFARLLRPSDGVAQVKGGVDG